MSLLVVALVLASSPPFINHGNRVSNNNNPAARIPCWAAEAMSPAAELVTRNVISGAAIFTVGDAAAQMLAGKKKPAAAAVATTKSATLHFDGDSTAVSSSSFLNKSNNNNNNALASATSKLDVNRLCSSTVLGAIWSGFCVPFIYGNVERTFPGKANLRMILIKVLVTCSILSTIGNYATMYARRFAALYTTYQFDKTSSLRLKWASKPLESVALFFAIFKGCFRSCNRDIGEVIVDDLKIWPLYDLTCYSLIPPAWRPITTSIMSSGWAMYMSVVSAKEEEEGEEESVSTSHVDVSPIVPPVCTTIEPPPSHHTIPVRSAIQSVQNSVHVTPLPHPFPPKHVSSSSAALTNDTTKRIIGVTGGSGNGNNSNWNNNDATTNFQQSMPHEYFANKENDDIARP